MLFSILLALINDPDKHFIVDSIGLTYFANTIINYDSFLSSRRPPESERFIGGRVLEMAENIFKNLQKSIVDSTILTATRLEIS